MSQNPNKLDLPSGYEYPDVIPDLVDSDFSTYQLQQQGNAQVYVEKFVVEKQYYEPFAGASLGSSKRSRRNCVLIKEDSFTDIGGGYASFLRHYARIPDNWFDYETKSILFYFDAFVGTPVGINYDYGCGIIPHGFSNCGFGVGYVKRNLTIQTKATRYYLTEGLLEQYLSNQFILPQSGASWKYDPTLPEASTENDYTSARLLNDIRVVPSRLILNEPRVKTSRDDSTEMVVAVDSIKKWQANIYELTRYTSQLQPSYVAGVSTLTVQLQWRFNANVSQTQINATTVQITNFSGNFYSNTNASAETLFTVAQQSSPPADYETTTSVVVQGGLEVLTITTTGGATVDSGTPFSTNLTTTWNGLNQVIFITLTIGESD